MFLTFSLWAAWDIQPDYLATWPLLDTWRRGGRHFNGCFGSYDAMLLLKHHSRRRRAANPKPGFPSCPCGALERFFGFATPVQVGLHVAGGLICADIVPQRLDFPASPGVEERTRGHSLCGSSALGSAIGSSMSFPITSNNEVKLIRLSIDKYQGGLRTHGVCPTCFKTNMRKGMWTA